MQIISLWLKYTAKSHLFNLRKRLKMHVDISSLSDNFQYYSEKSVLPAPHLLGCLWRLWQVDFKNRDLKICLFYWWRTFAFFHLKELVCSPGWFLLGTSRSNTQKAGSSLSLRNIWCFVSLNFPEELCMVFPSEGAVCLVKMPWLESLSWFLWSKTSSPFIKHDD